MSATLNGTRADNIEQYQETSVSNRWRVCSTILSSRCRCTASKRIMRCHETQISFIKTTHLETKATDGIVTESSS